MQRVVFYRLLYLIMYFKQNHGAFTFAYRNQKLHRRILGPGDKPRTAFRFVYFVSMTPFFQILSSFKFAFGQLRGHELV